jgi:hypothetical protein
MSFIVCVILCAVFRLIVVLFCVMCVICLLCLIVNHCHQVKAHLQLINITLHYIYVSALKLSFLFRFYNNTIINLSHGCYSYLCCESYPHDFIILKINADWYRLWSSSCNFIQPAIFTFFIGLNIFISTFFGRASKCFLPLLWETYVVFWHQYKCT